jgi:hypothetical protein
MAWTAPKTWAAGDIATANVSAVGPPQKVPLNLIVRDNLLVLKGPFSSTGKVVALDAAHVEQLHGYALEGVGHTDRGNQYTARNDFNAGTSTRLIVPVGPDRYAGGLRFRKGRSKFIAMECKEPGSTWVSSQYWEHVDQNKSEWHYLGSLISTPAAARIGSAWIGVDNYLHFIDAIGSERSTPGVTTGMHNDAAAKPGSVWIDVDNYTHWIGAGGQEYQGHADVQPHSDAAHVDAHTNTHTDSHSNSHSDTHTDTSHGDAHTNTHTDVGHTDSHTNAHSDVNHFDGIHQDINAHGDSHTNIAHDDVAHVDTHTNTAHQDSHSNVAHADTHSNVAHVDAHTNVAHTDHADVHFDQPELIGKR